MHVNGNQPSHLSKSAVIHSCVRACWISAIGFAACVLRLTIVMNTVVCVYEHIMSAMQINGILMRWMAKDCDQCIRSSIDITGEIKDK